MAYPSTIDTFAPRTDNVDDVLAADINAVYTVVELVETELGTDPAGSAADVKTRLAHSLSDGGYLSFDDSSELTIASGEITVTQNFHFIDTESDAASDYLDTINGGEAGWILFLRSTNDARDITVRHAVGNIYCSGGVNFSLELTNELAVMIYDGNLSAWLAAKLPGGTSLSGTGTASYIPFYAASNTLTSDDDLTFSTAAGLTGNETGGTAVDLRWESDAEENMLFLDASANNIYLGGTTTGVTIADGGVTSILTPTAGALTIGNGAAGVDYAVVINGETNDLTLTFMEDENYLKSSAVLRAATTLYRRYYHIPVAAVNPGGSGATWTAPSANTLGGWQLDAAGEVLYLQTDVHSDWDAASDLKLEVKFEVNIDNSGGGAGDTVDLKLVLYYKGDAETACKTQTQEVATTVGQSAQYKRFTCTFTINYDEASNVVEAGDVIRAILNLETDTSEVDNVVINSAEFYYNTTHLGIESGDV